VYLQPGSQFFQRRGVKSNPALIQQLSAVTSKVAKNHNKKAENLVHPLLTSSQEITCKTGCTIGKAHMAQHEYASVYKYQTRHKKQTASVNDTSKSTNCIP